MARNQRKAWSFGGVHGLEPRLLMAAPVIDPIASVGVPSSKTLFVPLTGSDADGDTVNYSVQSNNGAVDAKIYRGTTSLKLSVAGFGDLTFQLLPQVAPKTVATITNLVNSGFYNNLIFHRIISSFMVQGGDPTGTGSGGPGFQFDDEFNPEAIFSGNGQLAMANSGKDTNGSQFFVTVSSPRYLDFNHTIFGQLVRGFDVLNAIKAVPTTTNDRPVTDVKITSATMVANPTDAVLVLKSNSTGASTMTVTANDGTGNQVSSQFLATTTADTTNDPPILGPVANVVTATNTPINVALTSVDPENDPPIYDAAIVDQPVNGTINVTGNVVTVTPNSGFRGDIRVIVGVRQASGTTRFDTQVITVTVKDQMITAHGVDTSTAEGSAITTPLASFTTLIPLPASSYTASIAWGDGSTTSGTVTAGLNGSFDVRGTKTYDHFGSYPITVTIQPSAGGSSSSVTSLVTVTDAALSLQFIPLAPTAGTRTFTGTFATITDANPKGLISDLSAVIDWGDGVTSDATITPKGGGVFDIVGQKTYATEGSYVVRISLASPGGSSSSTRGVLSVLNLAPNLAAIAAKSVTEGSTLAFHVSATDPDSGQLLTYSLAAGAPAGAAIDPTTGDFTWLPTTGPTTVNVTVIATDNGLPQRSTSQTFSVSVINLAARVDLGGPSSLTQFETFTRSGRFDDEGSGPWSATVNYGDGTGTQPLTLNGDRSFTLSHLYSGAGAFSATVVVTDRWGAGGTANVPITVSARPLVVVAQATMTKKKGVITTITITWEGAVNSALAGNPANFTIATAGRDKKFGTRDDVVSRFRTATYDGAKITLIPAKRLVLSGTAQLRIAGLRDTFGRAIANGAGGLFAVNVK